MNKLIQTGVNYLKKNDPVLRRIIQEIGDCRLTPSNNYFQDLAETIISQQLSYKACKSIHNRLMALVRQDLTPAAVLSLTDQELRECGISGQKSKYIKGLAELFIQGDSLEGVESLEYESAVNMLTNINGIGRWSAEMFLIFSLNRLDILPLDDVGFINAFKKQYNADKTDVLSQIKKQAKVWGEFSSIAVWYLWQTGNN